MEISIHDNVVSSEVTIQCEESPENETNFDNSYASPKVDDLDLANTSRSGRVRKKPSKLMGCANNAKHKQKIHKAQKTQKSNDQINMPGPSGLNVSRSAKKAKKSKRSRKNKEKQNDSSSGDSQVSQSGSESSEESKSENDDRSMTRKKAVKFKNIEPPVEKKSKQSNSIYMMEKVKQKPTVKCGKIKKGEKSQRKDKGKARFTAYMLWSKEIREKLVLRYPNMDFATISKRLGDIWATVPYSEKTHWRKKAKRLVGNVAAKPKIVRTEPAWKFVAPVVPPKSSEKIRQNSGNKLPKQWTNKKIQVGGATSAKSRPNGQSSSVDNCSVYRVVGTEPIDVASHLTLLGESLMIIGELLSSHGGEVAISGALSVLLDSLLCVLGPVICLTQQVPEANGIRPEIHSQILDNLAYIMPGL